MLGLLFKGALMRGVAQLVLGKTGLSGAFSKMAGLGAAGAGAYGLSQMFNMGSLTDILSEHKEAAVGAAIGGVVGFLGSGGSVSSGVMLAIAGGVLGYLMEENEKPQAVHKPVPQTSAPAFSQP